jgi:hypothetical protein
MKKFEGWRTMELQFLASLIAARDMICISEDGNLYEELIREIRNRRIAEELFQMKLKGIEEE